MFCEWVFEAAKDLQNSNFVTTKIKNKEKKFIAWFDGAERVDIINYL